MDDMLRRALRNFLGLLKQLLTNLLGEDGETWTTEFKRFLRKELCWNFFTITDYPSFKTSEIVARLRKKFTISVYREGHLDSDFPSPKETTCRRFKKTVEADSEHKNKSADMLDIEGLSSITLRERLLMEELYFDETREHLDPKAWTICAGSRYPVGYVPYVLWLPGGRRVCVSWCGSVDRDPSARPRVAVS